MPDWKIAAGAASLILGILPAVPATADTAAGEPCAKSLWPAAQMIDRASAPDVTKDIAGIVKAHTRQLAMADKPRRGRVSQYP